MNVGAVFGIITAIIFMGMFLVFGFDTILKLFGLSGQAEIQKAVKDLEAAADTVYNLAEGAGQAVTVALPSDGRLCIIQPDNPASNPGKGWNPDFTTRYLLNTSSRGSNIWFSVRDESDFYTISHLAPAENFCVLKTTKLYLENAGDAVVATRAG